MAIPAIPIIPSRDHPGPDWKSQEGRPEDDVGDDHHRHHELNRDRLESAARRSRAGDPMTENISNPWSARYRWSRTPEPERAPEQEREAPSRESRSRRSGSRPKGSGATCPSCREMVYGPLPKTRTSAAKRTAVFMARAHPTTKIEARRAPGRAPFGRSREPSQRLHSISSVNPAISRALAQRP